MEHEKHDSQECAHKQKILHAGRKGITNKFPKKAINA